MNKLQKDLNSIQASRELKQKTLDAVMNSKNKKLPQVLLFVPVLICLILIAVISMPQSSSQETLAYVSFDINPSLELCLDENYKVIQTIAYNEDAKKMLTHVKLEGETFQSAVIKLLQDRQYLQYLQNGILEVGVFSDNQSMSTQLETTLNTLLTKHLTNTQFHCSQVDQETHHKASSHHTTAGKYQLIETILSYTDKYTFEDLNKLSIQKLYTILYQFNQEEVPEGCQPGHNQDSHHQSHH